MKRILHRTALSGLFLALALTLGACDLTELNDNPNEPLDPTLPFLLTNAQSDFANVKHDDFYSGRFGLLYAQYWSQTQYIEESRYQYPILRSGSVDAEWYDLYLLLNDLQEVIRINRATPELASAYGPNANQEAMVTIMQAYVWQYLTDIWGPAPFDQALQGREMLQVPYAPQETIYMSLIDSLNTAIGSIEVGSPTLTTGDLVFGGDMELWQAFGNSLKMRIAIRMADVAPGPAETAFMSAYNATTLDEVGATALIPFLTEPAYWNPIFSNANSRDDWAVSTTLLGLMNELEDPRRAAYAQVSEVTGEYVGFPYGLESGPANQIWAGNNFSRPGERVAYRPDAPGILMLPDEVLFMKAEAAARGWTGDDPAMLYEQAITASMNYWGVTDQAAIDAYIAQVPFDAGDWRQSIGVQKWLAFYMQGIQGWSTFRRLGFEGVLVAPPDNPGEQLFGSWYPVRLPYPGSEASLNGENYEAAVGILGGEDTQGTRLWWDVNPVPEPAPRSD